MIKQAVKHKSEYTAAAEIDWLWVYFPRERQQAALPTIGKELVAISHQHNLPIRGQLSIRYNEIYVYHYTAVEMFRRRLDNDFQYLAKYRYQPLGL